MYALVDCNNFYASCERVFQPKFNGNLLQSCLIMMVVLFHAVMKEGGRIGMGAPLSNKRKQQHDVQLFSSNYALYGDLSNE
jgi:DNA polymerase V